MCTIPIMQVPGTLIYHNMQSLEVNNRLLFGAKVVLMSVAAALPGSASFMVEKDAKFFPLQQSRYLTKTLSGSLNHYLELGIKIRSRAWSWGHLISRGKLACSAEEAYYLLSIMVLDALGTS